MVGRRDLLPGATVNDLSISQLNKAFREANKSCSQNGGRGNRRSKNTPLDRDFIELVGHVGETQNPPDPNFEIMQCQVVGIGKPEIEPAKGDADEEQFFKDKPRLRAETVTQEQIDCCRWGVVVRTHTDDCLMTVGISGLQVARVIVRNLDHCYATPVAGEVTLETSATGSAQILHPFPDNCMVGDELVVAVRMSNCASAPCMLYMTPSDPFQICIDDEVIPDCLMPFILASPAERAGDANDPRANMTGCFVQRTGDFERVYLPNLIDLVKFDVPDGQMLTAATKIDPDCYGIPVDHPFYVDIDPVLGLFTKNSLYSSPLTLVTDIICGGIPGSPGLVDFILTKQNHHNGQILRAKRSEPISCGPPLGCCCTGRTCTAIIDGNNLDPVVPTGDEDCRFTFQQDGANACFNCAVGASNPLNNITRTSYTARCFSDPLNTPGVQRWQVDVNIECVGTPTPQVIGSGSATVTLPCTNEAYMINGTIEVRRALTMQLLCTLNWEIACTEFIPPVCEDFIP